MTTLAGTSVLTIIITPAGNGRYEARLPNDDRTLSISKTPFFDAARQLIADGYDPCATLVMRHAGSETECLLAGLGKAAALTIEETPYGPKLRVWKPLPALAGASTIAPFDPVAHPADLPPYSAKPIANEPGEIHG